MRPCEKASGANPVQMASSVAARAPSSAGVAVHGPPTGCACSSWASRVPLAISACDDDQASVAKGPALLRRSRLSAADSLLLLCEAVTDGAGANQAGTCSGDLELAE